jgi:hypothetical protein
MNKMFGWIWCISLMIGVIYFTDIVNGGTSNMKIQTDEDVGVIEITENVPHGMDGGELSIGDVRTIGRISQGVLRIIDKRNQGRWYCCGELVNQLKQKELSVNIAYQIVSTQRSIRATNISPWGILSTMYNESGLDACALGVRPRQWAYSQGLLVKNKFTISHSREEILKFVGDPRAIKTYRKSGFDLGYCQILSRFYPGQESDMLDANNGIRMCVIEMQHRSKYNKTDRPWLYWKTFSPSSRYRQKIRRWAKIMGANQIEMTKL